MSMIKTLEWTDAGVRFIDQTKLPTEEVYVTCKTYGEVADAIKDHDRARSACNRRCRSHGNCAGRARLEGSDSGDELAPEFEQICQVIGATRPTAVNLFWAIRRMQDKFAALHDKPVSRDQAGDDRRSPTHARGRHCRQ